MVTLARQTAQFSNATPAQRVAVQKIYGLDLEPIVFKLTASEHGESPKMTLEEADQYVALYRQFLILNVIYPGKSIVPNRGLDEVWHAHILDTSKYEVDCGHIFGRLLHHFPYLGLRGPEDVAVWQAAFAETNRLYMEHFGVTLASDASGCGESCGGSLCESSGCESSACDSSVNPAQRERPRPMRATA